jgi:hypothetical protein
MSERFAVPEVRRRTSSASSRSSSSERRALINADCVENLRARMSFDSLAPGTRTVIARVRAAEVYDVAMSFVILPGRA